MKQHNAKRIALEDFEERLVSAVVRKLEIIGEAATRTVREDFPMLRNRIAIFRHSTAH